MLFYAAICMHLCMHSHVYVYSSAHINVCVFMYGLSETFMFKINVHFAAAYDFDDTNAPKHDSCTGKAIVSKVTSSSKSDDRDSSANGSANRNADAKIIVDSATEASALDVVIASEGSGSSGNSDKSAGLIQKNNNSHKSLQSSNR